MRISLVAQNVGINSGGTTPNTSAILDLNTGNVYGAGTSKGLIVPNVSLSTTADNATVPVGASQQSMLVYNTNNAITGTGAGGKGYYWWDNTSSLWINLLDNLQPTTAWLTTGNAGTIVGTNFLGTTDNVDLQFRANNVRSGLIDIANYQTFFGYTAGQNTTAAGTLNSFFGYAAGNGNTSGISNTGIGYNAIIANTIGNYNTAMGVQTLATASGSNNTALGVNSGYSISSGGNNTALGFYAMNNQPAAAITGSNNTAVGYNSGINTTTGSYNTLLGYNSQISTSTFTNSTGVGAYSYPGASDALILGSIAGLNTAANSTKVGIGTTTPADALVVKIPAASAINGITADVTPGNGSGNAINALSTGVVSVSTIFAEDKPAADGTGVPITTSNHAINGQIKTSHIYSYGVYGTFDSPASVLHAGGVVGYYNFNGNWGGLGYYSGFACYGGYFSGSNANQNGGAGRLANPTATIAQNVGIGAYGDLFGGWVRGNVYGLAVKGERVSLYVDGKTVVNQPIIQLTKTADDKTIVNYTPVSATADLQLHGVVHMEKGIAFVAIDASTLSQFVSIDDLTIIATPTGQTNGVYAGLKDGKLIIKENNNGTSNTKVSWIIIGKRNIPENFVPAELIDKNFDANLKGFMYDENDKDNSTNGNGLYWDGTKLNKGSAPK